ncbi:MAG: ATP-binding protein [Alistipes shahii]
MLLDGQQHHRKHLHAAGQPPQKWTKSQVGRMNSVVSQGGGHFTEVVLFASKMSGHGGAGQEHRGPEYDIPGPITVHCDVDDGQDDHAQPDVQRHIKYTKEGGRIIISVRDTPSHAVIAVRDFGIGIKEEDIPQTAQPPKSTTPPTERRTKRIGTGIADFGAGILTRRNGGEVTIELRRRAKAPTFTFTIAKEQPETGKGRRGYRRSLSSAMTALVVAQIVVGHVVTHPVKLSS